MDSNLIYRAAVVIVPLVIAIVFHEVAHGWAARALGDPTAHEQRRLSFNPLRHVDPMGTLILPLGLALAHAPVFGWALPVPVDMRRLRNPRIGMMIVALAGPAMNLTLAAVGAVLLGVSVTHRIGDPQVARFVADVLLQFVFINIFLALFNLLPLPPFDGSHVVEGLLPRRLAAGYARMRPYGIVLMIGLLVVLPMALPGLDLVGRFVGPPMQWLTARYLHLADWIA